MHFGVMELRREQVDRMSKQSCDERSALQEWVRGSLRHSYDSVLREDLPRELLDLLPKQ